MQETQVVRSLGRKDPPKKEMATYSSILAWKIPGTEEPGGLQSVGLQRVEHNLVTEHSCAHTHTHTHKVGKVQERAKFRQVGVFP